MTLFAWKNKVTTGVRKLFSHLICLNKFELYVSKTGLMLLFNKIHESTRHLMYW